MQSKHASYIPESNTPVIHLSHYIHHNIKSYSVVLNWKMENCISFDKRKGE